MNLQGDIEPALRYGQTQIGKPYDHHANTEARFGERKFDCSGFCSRCLWNGGMPRYHEGFGEGSASMAAWSEDHPEMRLPIDKAKATRGALLVFGGTAGTGDAGHVVFSLGNGQTLEANGSRGVCIDNVNRLTWSHGLLAPVHYQEDDLDAVDKKLLTEVHQMLSASKAPNGEMMVNQLWKACFTPAAAAANLIRNIEERTKAIATKLGV